MKVSLHFKHHGQEETEVVEVNEAEIPTDADKRDDYLSKLAADFGAEQIDTWYEIEEE